MRRALARARDGKPLDQTEAAVLLHARGDDLRTLLGYARTNQGRRPGSGGPARDHHLLEEGLHPADPAVPGPLRLLHVRDRAEAPRQPVPQPRRGAGHRPRRRAARLQGGPLHPGGPPGGPVAAGQGVAGRARLRRHAVLRPGDGDPGPRGDRTAAAPEPRSHDLAGLPAAQAGRAEHGHDARDDLEPPVHETKGGPHFGSPDKDPKVRLRVLEDAGRSNVPFTTGILIGIGETIEERADSIFAIRQVSREYSGIQEVIVQNFRAKPDTKMRDTPDAELDGPGRDHRGHPPRPWPEGPRPGAAEPRRRPAPAHSRRGHRRLGRRLAADPGPRQPRAPLAADRRARPAHGRGGLHAAGNGSRSTRPTSASPGSTRASRGTSPPSPTRGPASRTRPPAREGMPWQEPDGGWGDASGRTDLHVSIDTIGRSADRREDFSEVYGDWETCRNVRG